MEYAHTTTILQIRKFCAAERFVLAIKRVISYRVHDGWLVCCQRTQPTNQPTNQPTHYTDMRVLEYFLFGSFVRCVDNALRGQCVVWVSGWAGCGSTHPRLSEDADVCGRGFAEEDVVRHCGSFIVLTR